MTKLSRVLQFAFAQSWAMEEGFQRRMFAVLMQHDDANVAKIAEAVRSSGRAAAGGDAAGSAEGMRIDRGVAVIPIRGVIAQRASAVDPLCGDVGTSVEHIRGDLQKAMADDSVKSILLAIDSPGGSVAGLDDLATEIRAARGKKPIVAHTDGMMASAAYWLGSQASKVYITRDAAVGSIGVIASFIDNHRALQERGLDPVVMKSVPGKGHVQGNGTFGDNNRADLQAELDQFHAMFVDAVAAGRGLPREQADAMGDGRVHIGRQALERKFVDGTIQFEAAMRHARAMGRVGAAAAAGAVIVDVEDAAPEMRAEIQPTPVGNVAGGSTKAEEPMTEQVTKGVDNTPSPAHEAQIAAATKAAADAENHRAQTILAAAAGVQRDLAAKLIADRTPLAEALLAINKDLQSRLDASKFLPTAGSEPLAQGNSAQVVSPPKKPDPIEAMEDGPEKWAAQYKADKTIREEFDALAVMAQSVTMKTENGPRAATGLDLYMASMRNAGKARLVSKREIESLKREASAL